jgi:hypothetical protein
MISLWAMRRFARAFRLSVQSAGFSRAKKIKTVEEKQK